MRTTQGTADARLINAPIERGLTLATWLIGAALCGWAMALAIGFLGDRAHSKLTPWTPPTLVSQAGPRENAVASASATGGPWQLVGIADDRIYIRSNNKPASFAEGETLPNGDRVQRIERDAVVVLSGGKETRIALFKSPASDAAKGAPVATAATATASCRLSAQDRANATFIDPAIAAALLREGATFNRMFVPLVAASEGGGGVRASNTGGTTSAFGINDGDTLFRAEGRAITSGQSVLNEIIARVQRGEAVVVEGERAGTARRWVFAPSVCR